MSQNGKKNNALFEYCLHLGDNSLILGHRLSELCGHGPILEEDIALTNISLDLVGQSRTLLAYAGEVESKGRSEDDLAYLRDLPEFRNFMIVEQPNGDFAFTIVKQFLFSAYSYYLYYELRKSTDERLAAIAEKSIKEVAYHLRHSSEWLIRLGDGTEESHKRVEKALDELWMYTGELFEPAESDIPLIEKGIAADPRVIRKEWDKSVSEILSKATVDVPGSDRFMMRGSRVGRHTEYLGYILAELQFVQRAYPGSEW